LSDHVERLFVSAQIIGLSHPYAPEEVARYINDLISTLGESDAYNIKILLIGAKEKEDCLLYVFPSFPRFPEKKNHRDGVKVISVPYQRSFPAAKTLNMLGSYLAFKKAREHDCYDALAVDTDGYITEGTMTNFFLVKGKTIVMPLSGKALLGITQKIILQLAPEHGFAVEERSVAVPDVSAYDGAFLTSTSTKVMPIKQIDEYVFPTIPESIHTLRDLYDDFWQRSRGVL
jgi:branched-subunit amino acid aminotransferase/4-amino-4-deoxychorismate lyase